MLGDGFSSVYTFTYILGTAAAPAPLKSGGLSSPLRCSFCEAPASVTADYHFSACGIEQCRFFVEVSTRSSPGALLIQFTGTPISADQLFNYSNGRFLVNERYELSRRHVTFNVDNLCALVSSLPSVLAPVSRIDKQEGGFNKALIVTTANGKQLVVKIPFPALVPARYSVESEVATLKFGIDSYIFFKDVSDTLV